MFGRPFWNFLKASGKIPKQKTCHIRDECVHTILNRICYILPRHTTTTGKESRVWSTTLCTPGKRVEVAPSYLRVLWGVDDLSLPVHHPVNGDPRDDVRLDELQTVYKLSRGSGELRLVCGVKGLLPAHPLQRDIGKAYITTLDTRLILTNVLNQRTACSRYLQAQTN